MFVPIYTFTTTGASVATVTFDTGVSTATAFKFELDVLGFESTTPAVYGVSLEGGGRTTGSAATIVGTEFRNIFNDAALAACNVTVVASGNTLQLQVTGATGLTINWNAAISIIYV